MEAARWYYEVGDEEAAATLARLLGDDRRPRVLLRGATVVTLDPGRGDLSSGDVLLGGRTVEAIGPDLVADGVDDENAVVVDCRGMIVMPGFVEAHRHCWQNQFRRLIPDADLNAYVATTHGGMALHYRPEDMYAGTLVSGLGMLETGVTTVLDFSHNSRSRAHSDAAFRAYADAGIRAVHASAAPNAGDWDEQWPDDIPRLDEQFCTGDGTTTSVRMGIDQWQHVLSLPDLFAFARAHGLALTLDGVMGPPAACEVERLGEQGLLGPDVTLIHCTALSDEAWRHIAGSGTRVTLATTSDQQIGLADGVPPIQKALDHGLRPSLSADVEICLAGDLFTQMRTTLVTQRMHAQMEKYRGEAGPAFLSNRDVLEFATIEAARAIGLDARIGTLEPGKDADVTLIRAEDPANMPLNNAVGTIVQGTDSANVDAVFVAGRVRKWRGRLVGADLDRARRIVRESRDHIASRAGLVVDPIASRGRDDLAFDHIRGRLGAMSHE